MLNPSGLCQCGCGEKAPVARCNSASGYVKGEPLRFRRGHNKRLRGPRWRVERETGCWVWQWAEHQGYGEVSKMIDGRQCSYKAHRVVWEEVRGAIPAGLVLHHKCENKLCVNPDHLELLGAGEHARMHMQGSKRPDASSRFEGVYWFTARGRWAAWGRNEHGTIITLGCFEDELEAARVACEHREGVVA